MSLLQDWLQWQLQPNTTRELLNRLQCVHTPMQRILLLPDFDHGQQSPQSQ